MEKEKNEFVKELENKILLLQEKCDILQQIVDINNKIIYDKHNSLSNFKHKVESISIFERLFNYKNTIRKIWEKI
jgi:hypothetical protein